MALNSSLLLAMLLWVPFSLWQSYYGALLCVAWSSDGKYIFTGTIPSPNAMWTPSPEVMWNSQASMHRDKYEMSANL